MQANPNRTAVRLAWMPALAILAALLSAYALSDGFRDATRHAFEMFASGDRAKIAAWTAQHGAWGPVLLLLIALLQTVIPILPSIAFMIAAIVAYGAGWGSLIAWTGAMAAAALAYGIGRGIGPHTVDRLMGRSKRKKIQRVVERYGAWAIVLARISPVLSTDAVSYAAGLVRMPFVRFFVATGVGTLPLVALIAVMGTTFARLQTVLAITAVAGLAALVAHAMWNRRRATEG